MYKIPLEHFPSMTAARRLLESVFNRTFNFAICSWSNSSDFSVMESIVFYEVGTFLALEGWSVVTFELLGVSKSRQWARFLS